MRTEGEERGRERGRREGGEREERGKERRRREKERGRRERRREVRVTITAKSSGAMRRRFTECSSSVCRVCREKV